MRWKVEGHPGAALRVLVTGSGGNIGQSVLRALDRSGLASRIVAADCEPLSVGLLVADRGVVLPPAGDPAYADALARVLETEAIDALIPASDPEILPLARLKTELEARTGVVVLVGAEDRVGRASDKLETARWLEAEGLPHPRSAPADDEPAVRHLVEACGFPLIVKPRRAYGSSGLVVAGDAAELAAALGPGRVVQEHLGDATAEFTSAAFTERSGRVVAAVVMRRTLARGTSYRIELVRDAALEAVVAGWAGRLGLVGSANFQFRLREGEPVPFEINYRFSGTTSIRAALGFDDVAMSLRHFVLGERIEPPGPRPGVALRYWDELVLPGHGFETLSRQLKDAHGT